MSFVSAKIEQNCTGTGNYNSKATRQGIICGRQTRADKGRQGQTQGRHGQTQAVKGRYWQSKADRSRQRKTQADKADTADTDRQE